MRFQVKSEIIQEFSVELLHDKEIAEKIKVSYLFSFPLAL